MADSGGPELPYGHLGRASYDPDEQTWSFQRANDQAFRLRPLGEPRLVAKPAEIEDVEARLEIAGQRPSERYPRQLQDLVKRHPELQPASDFLPPLLHVSEAVQSATARHDPLKGNLLAFGTIPSEASHKTLTIAAFTTGPVGSDLRLVQVQNQRKGWDDARDAWIEVPTIHGEQAIWSGERVPIQQVCFAQTIERTDTFLAARLPTRTLIFRPLLRREPVSGPSASRLDANCIFDVPIANTGGLPHADVAFNPWYTRQFGTVDQAGCWSIWQLEGRSTSSAKCICTGSVLDNGSGSTKAADDGWARITWVSDLSTVGVCTRRRLALHKINDDGSTTSETTVVIDLTDGRGWILDFVLMPSQPSHLCVLTSSHITLYLVDEGGKVASAVMTIRHFRNPEDMTLSLSAFQLDDDILLLVRSSMDREMTVFKVRFEGVGRVNVADPSAIVLPLSDSGDGIAGMHLATAPFGTSRRQQELESVLTLRHRDQGVRLVTLSLLEKDMALRQMLYYTAPSQARVDGVTAPTWEAKLGASSTKVRRERFVVDDEEDIEFDEGRQRPVSSFMRRRKAQVANRARAEWTVNFQLTAQVVEHANHLERRPMGEALLSAENVLRSQKAEDAVPWRTLRELSLDELQVMDLEDDTRRLNALLLVEPDPETQTQGAEAQPQENSRLVIRKLSQTPADDLSGLYDDMVRAWITPLPAGVPGRVRLAKDHLVRRAAAEVALASHVIRIEQIEQPSQPETQPSQEYWQLPVRGAGSSSSQAFPSASHPMDRSSQLARSQQSVLPTPSPSATPSSTTTSSHPSSFTALEVSRLRQYTTFTAPPPTALPRSLNNILTHWTPNTDPATYDWRSTSRRIAQREDEEGDEHLTEKERARMQRKAERHIRRQRREAAATEAAQAARGRAPEIVVSASQPMQRKPESQSQGNQWWGGAAGSSQSQGQSQSQVAGIGASSQVVPGRFGGRPAKKKRKQGF